MNTFDELLLGESPELRAVLRAAQIAAATEVTTLIQGESGTGKALLATALHRESTRRDGPFISVNCATLPAEQAESELFGQCQSAFPGADEECSGRIRAADGGTLFLDEVGELPLAAQARLLRFLTSSEVQGVGSTSSQRVNVRVVASTRHDLFARAKEGLFREDLFFHLKVVPLELPPLRQRTGDVALLLRHLSHELAAQHQVEQPHFSPRAMTIAEQYSWPGNVRELRNFCERMVILFAGRSVEPANLPAEMRTPVVEDTPFILPDTGIRLDELEQQMIRQALDKTQGNRSRAARLLGISRDTLLYRLKKYAIQ